jgi:hypothetical protein
MKTINRSFVQEFSRKHKIKGLSDFLVFVSTKKGYEVFRRYCEHNMIVIEPVKEKILFHGSISKIERLEPFKQPDTSKKSNLNELYATSDAEYALFMSSLSLKSGSAGVISSRRSTRLTVNLSFVNGASKLVKGYVYVLDGNQFKSCGNNEFVTTKSAKALFRIETTSEDIATEIVVENEKAGKW